MSPGASGRSPELFCGKDLAVTEREFDEYWMRAALREASKAAEDGEVPTGCMIVEPGPEAAEGEWTPSTARILARAHNQTEGLVDATAHAEMLALSSAFAVKGNWRLAGCRLYVTKEPCPMCAGAIVLSRVSRVIWGLGDPKRGGGTVFGIFSHPGINHHPQITEGVLEEESRAVLQDFFRRRRAESSAAALERAEK
jgi:tRNA(adenine34) deaminase